MVDLLAVERADRAAVAQHHDAIGALLDLVQSMRNEDDADAARLEGGDDLEQAARLGERQARRRLVHDDEPGIEGQRLGDFEQLLLGDRQFGDGRIGPEVDLEAVEQRLDATVYRLAIDQLQRAAPERLTADEDIGGHVEIVEKIEFLVDEGNAGGRRLVDVERGALGAVDADHALGRRNDAAEHPHQSRFACAILADEPDHFARRHEKTDVPQRHHARIGLGDRNELEKGGGAGQGRMGLFDASSR